MRDWLRGLGALLDMCPWRVPMIAWMVLGTLIIVFATELVKALR